MNTVKNWNKGVCEENKQKHNFLNLIFFSDIPQTPADSPQLDFIQCQSLTERKQ